MSGRRDLTPPISIESLYSVCTIAFISHVHIEENCADMVETVLTKALLGGLAIFNSSNHESISHVG